MMAVGSVASLSVVGAPFGAPLLVTGMAVAGASYITRKHAERQAKKEQPTQDSPQKEHQNASAARRADNPPSELAEVAKFLGTLIATIQQNQQANLSWDPGRASNLDRFSSGAATSQSWSAGFHEGRLVDHPPNRALSSAGTDDSTRSDQVPASSVSEWLQSVRRARALTIGRATTPPPPGVTVTEQGAEQTARPIQLFDQVGSEANTALAAATRAVPPAAIPQMIQTQLLPARNQPEAYYRPPSAQHNSPLGRKAR